MKVLLRQMFSCQWFISITFVNECLETFARNGENTKYRRTASHFLSRHTLSCVAINPYKLGFSKFSSLCMEDM